MNILFISEMLPIDTYASSVVFYRHFKRLSEEGHIIHIVTDRNSYINRQKEIPSNFTVHIVPNRKFYYPPYRASGVFQKLRFLDYYYRHVGPIIKANKIDRLLSYIHGDFLSPFSAYVQGKSKLPLITFFHDDVAELNHFKPQEIILKNTSKVLQASSRVLIASEGFYLNWSKFASKFTLLYPIPAQNNQLIDIVPDDNGLIIGYSGTVYNEMIPALELVSKFSSKLDFDLKIVGNNTKAHYLAQKYEKVECLPMFENADQANYFLKKNCHVCIIPYPESVAEMPWIRTCFPSKFIQYCLLGIPTVIIAPADSAVGQWCIKNKWILYSESYRPTAVQGLIEKATSSQDVREQVKLYKEEVFNPESIHKKFKNIMFFIEDH